VAPGSEACRSKAHAWRLVLARGRSTASTDNQRAESTRDRWLGPTHDTLDPAGRLANLVGPGERHGIQVDGF
jgi:hypothetical protein